MSRLVRTTVALTVTCCLALVGCTSDRPGPERGPQEASSSQEPTSSSSATQAVTASTRPPAEPTVVLPGTSAVALAAGTSEQLFEEAPIALLAGADDLPAQGRGASLAVALGVPLLLTSPPDGDDGSVTGELARLGTTSVLVVGTEAARWADALGSEVSVVAAPSDPGDLVDVTGIETDEARQVAAGELTATVAGLERGGRVLVEVPPEEGEDTTGTESLTTEATALPALEPGAPVESVTVLTTGEPAQAAAVATARAAGAEVLVTPATDPRADVAVIEALAQQPPAAVLALGDGFGDAERLRARVDVAATGVQLPGGGQVLFPDRLMIALYGHPATASLGVLGEQPLQESIARAQEVASEYEPLTEATVVPTFELITTVASSSPGRDGDYSNEATVTELRPYVDAAREAGVYVVLDLQPGRTDFLTQAQLYAELLAEPHVGLALDPEWRLEPGQVHLQQIGGVDAAEVNSVVTWLADLTAENDLPQKLLVLHQFRLSMLRDRDQIDTSRDELALLVHGDGNGTPELKMETWEALTSSLPEGMWLGWKNFYDEDSPTFTPAETMDVEPPPVFVSYQ
jgi:hypothetical protein